MCQTKRDDLTRTVCNRQDQVSEQRPRSQKTQHPETVDTPRLASEVTRRVKTEAYGVYGIIY